MPLPESLAIALKEWAAVCRALEAGRQILLFRKGGIHEAAGEFQLDHSQFLLFPSYLHQKLKMIKFADRGGIEEKNLEPTQITISTAGVVSDIVRIDRRSQLNALEPAHVWTPELLDIRWNYRPENPFYILLLRTYSLKQAAIVANSLAYAGCKSWVPLDEKINTKECLPILTDEEYQHRRESILKELR